MTKTLKDIAIISVSVAALFALAMMFTSLLETAYSSAPSGLRSVSNEVDFTAVGPQERITIFDRSTTCTSRVITTGSTTIRIMMASSSVAGFATSTTNLGVGRGLIQAASTTVAYDSGLHGCDWWAVYGFDASTTLTLIENF